MANHLYYGDNLDMLRDHIPDESIDLISLTPRSTAKRPTTSNFMSRQGNVRRHTLKPLLIIHLGQNCSKTP